MKGGRNVDNAAIAERLEAFATLLDLAGAGYYSARAYRRAAELIRATNAPVAELVRAGRVRELRGIGTGIEARLRELVETGEIAELRELEREVDPELVGLGRFLGLAPKRAVGATVEGVPVELVVAEPARFGTDLLRATGSEAYVEALGPLPDAAEEEDVYRALGIPWLPPELREEPFRGEPPPLVELSDVG